MIKRAQHGPLVECISGSLSRLLPLFLAFVDLGANVHGTAVHLVTQLLLALLKLLQRPHPLVLHQLSSQTIRCRKVAAVWWDWSGV